MPERRYTLEHRKEPWRVTNQTDPKGTMEEPRKVNSVAKDVHTTRSPNRKGWQQGSMVWQKGSSSFACGDMIFFIISNASESIPLLYYIPNFTVDKISATHFGAPCEEISY